MADEPLAVLSKDQRTRLVELAKNDPEFRNLLKTNWADAMVKAGVDPRDVKGKLLRQTDLVPFKGGPSTAGIEITIEIMSVAKEERVNLSDIVVFDDTKT